MGKKIADKIDGVLEEISYGLTEEERVAFYRSLSISNGIQIGSTGTSIQRTGDCNILPGA